MMRFVKETSTPDVIYYNASLVNANIVDMDDAPFAKFFEQRQIPLVHDASQYWFSVIRLVANGPGRGLPLFQPQIQKGQADPDLTIYSFSIEYKYVGPDPNGDQVESPPFIAQAFVRYNAEDKRIPKARAPLQNVDASTDYYNVHSYFSFVQSCNDAIYTAFYGSEDSITTQLDAWADSLNWPTLPKLDLGLLPILSYDGATGLFSLTVSVDYQDHDEPANLAIYMNGPAQNLFANFPLERFDYDKGCDYKFVVNRYLSGNMGAIKLTQDRVSTDQIWSPIDNFVFISTLLPTLNEFTSPPLVLGVPDAAPAADFSPQVTDCSVFLARSDDNVSMLYYAPSPQYRLVDLGTQKQGISSVDLQLFWRHRLTQDLHPIKLTSLSNVSLKIAFIKKDTSK